MKTSKKLTLTSLGILLSPVLALAQPRTIGNIETLIWKIEQFVWILFGGIAVVCFVVAGILFLTAQGEPDKIKSARSAFIWGVVGVVVGVIAYSIMAIVSNFLA